MAAKESDERMGTFLSSSFFLFLCVFFFSSVHNYLLLTFTINNKWMETMKKNICKTIFHLINSCRVLFSFRFLPSLYPTFCSLRVWMEATTLTCSGRRNDALETQNAIMMILLAKRVKKNAWKLILVSCRPDSRSMWRTARCSLFSTTISRTCAPPPILFPTRAITERRSAIE